MSQNLSEESLIRNYFLEALPEEEQDVVQQRLLIDVKFLEKSRMIEGELIDEYALGLLPRSDQLRLEEGLLKSPQQYRRVQLIRTLEKFRPKFDALDRGFEELNQLAAIETRGLRELFEEEAAARKYVTTRYQTLIDRKYEHGLSPSENEELDGLKAALDEMDEAYYCAIIKRLRTLVEERGV
jgi:hypothetical protein